jgi:penicillin-binding protein 2
VRLTLDLELQRAAKVAMKDVYAGAVVVLDAHTGAVLAMYSKPSFDPNTMSGKRTPQAKTGSDVAAYAPLLNRAVHAFPPASTFKVVAAIAGLELGVIRQNSTWRCPGYYDFGGRRFHCHSKRGHGEVNVQQALRSSCDVFFYHLGEQLGVDRMAEYARKLGFGEPTGIEIHEAQDRLPTMQWYKEHVPGGYYPGYALSTAVGQKDVTATPLQMARVYAAIATGHLPDAGLIAGLETQDGKLQAHPRGLGRDLEFKRSTLQLVRAALRSVVNEEGGTAYSAQPLHTTMAGKTGTAQAAQRPRKEALELLRGETAAINRLASWLQNDHAWFVGYAPADAPEIAVAVFIEHGGSGGHNAAPVGKAVVESWFTRHGPKVQPVETLPVARKAHLDKKEAPDDEDQTAEVPVHDPEAAPSVPDESDDAQPLPGVTVPGVTGPGDRDEPAHKPSPDKPATHDAGEGAAP